MTTRATRALSSRGLSAVLLIVAVLANIGFYLPSVPQVPVERVGIPRPDALYHVGAFALTVWALSRVLRGGRRAGALAAAALATAHAFVIELVQARMPQRSADPTDVVADLIGVLLGLAAWALLPPHGRPRGAATAPDAADAPERRGP